MSRQRRPIIEGLFCRKCGDEKISKLHDKAQSGNQRYACASCGSRMTKPFKERPQLLPRFSKAKSKRYIVTSVMSDCALHEPLWATLGVIERELDARTVSIGTVGVNPNLMNRGSPLRFPSETVNTICRERFNLCSNLTVRGDFSIEHNVLNPLTGANNSASMESEIFGHAQTAVRMIATPKTRIPKGMFTTSTVSLPKYASSARARKAEPHHSFGATLVEVKGSTFWPTQLRWDDKNECIDFLGKRYTPYGVSEAPPLAGIVYGDIHEDVLTPRERDAFWRLCNGAGADKNIICDVLDFHTGSHHNDKDVIRRMRGADLDIRGEIERAAKFVGETPNCVLVSSNHHEHLDQWYNRSDRRKLAHYLDLYDDLTDIGKRHNDVDLFVGWCRDAGYDFDVTHPNREYMVGGNDVAQHGHRGPNGARGSMASFAKTGCKTVIQHSHTPGWDKGCMQVGTSSMHHAYAQGYSSWAVAHGLITRGGERSLLFCIKDKFSPLTEEWLANGG